MNNTDFDIHNIIPSLKKWASSNPSVYRLWIFGSYVKGNYHSKSDIDLAVQIRSWCSEDSHQIYYLDHNDWRQELQDLLSFKIGFAFYSNIEPYCNHPVKKEIDRYGCLVYEDNLDM